MSEAKELIRQIKRETILGQANSEDVKSAIDRLPNSSTPNRPGLKELLTQLQAAMEADPNLSHEDKAEAFALVIVATNPRRDN